MDVAFVHTLYSRHRVSFFCDQYRDLQNWKSSKNWIGCEEILEKPLVHGGFLI